MPWLDRGGDRRLRRLEAAFADEAPDDRRMERLAREYGRVLIDELRQRPDVAARLFRDYDGRVPAAFYGPAFPPAERGMLAGLASSWDIDVLTVTFGAAGRLGMADVRRQALTGLAGLLGEQGDAERLIAGLDQWRALGVLDRDTVALALRGHLKRAGFAQDAKLWRDFFTAWPGTLMPDLFAIHAFAGNGVQAVRLADSAAERQEALECCLRSSRLDNVRAGLELARREGDARLFALEHRVGDLLFERGDYAEALPHFQAAGRRDRESECHERLGGVYEAFATCPDDRPDRLARLARECWTRIDVLVERGDYERAVRQAREIVDRLRAVSEPDEALAAELSARRDAVMAAGRAHFPAAGRHLARQGGRVPGVEPVRGGRRGGGRRRRTRRAGRRPLPGARPLPQGGTARGRRARPAERPGALA
jgi:molecular chaperone DnaK